MANAGDSSRIDGGYWHAPDTPAAVPAPPPAGPFSVRSGDQSAYGLGVDHRSARGVATAVVVMLAIMAVLSLAAAGARANRASLVDDMRDGRVGVAEIDDADGLVAGATVLDVLGLLSTGILFIIWQHRHATNARSLAHRVDGLGAGWAIGGWFIPFANLVLPAVQIHGSSRESDPDLPVPPRSRQGKGSAIVVPWAVLFGVGAMLERAGSVFYPDERDVLGAGDFERFLSDAARADRLVALGMLVNVAAAIVAIVMVRSLTARQDARAAAVRAVSGYGVSHPGVARQWPPPPPPSPLQAPAPWAPPGGTR